MRIFETSVMNFLYNAATLIHSDFENRIINKREMNLTMIKHKDLVPIFRKYWYHKLVNDDIKDVEIYENNEYFIQYFNKYKNEYFIIYYKSRLD